MFVCSGLAHIRHQELDAIILSLTWVEGTSGQLERMQCSKPPQKKKYKERIIELYMTDN